MQKYMFAFVEQVIHILSSTVKLWFSYKGDLLI